MVRLPPLAWRDRRIAGSEAQVRQLESGRAVHIVRPSFEAMVQAERRMTVMRKEMAGGVVRPRGKFNDYQVAHSQGVDNPRQLERWDHPAQIVWDELPDLVVVKSAHGSAGRGVLPLRR
jgi:hypothetical protein